MRGASRGDSSGSGEINSNFMQLLLLRKEEIPDLDAWLEKSQDRFTSPDIQNEILQIMALTVLRGITERLTGRYFSIMVDETTDISNVEQLVFCIRFVDGQLNCHEEFIGLHSMDSISADSIIRTIEDILLRLSLSLQNCRGQCYDGASSMAGCKTGVSTTILQKEHRALYTIEEMTKLIKKSLHIWLHSFPSSILMLDLRYGI